jgi:predicted regulator of Ras-like GTPase activity (Roadblock/LC7/MglB family)
MKKMKIPFLDRLKKGKGRSKQTATPQKASKTPAAKPESERLSKTVMPHATRTVTTQESAGASDGTLEGPSTPRAISFGPKKKAVKELPPAVALALEPRVERAISLDLPDVLKQLPEGMTKPLESLDASRRFLLKASELEKKMATGKPSVALTSIYEQAPEIFLKPVETTDTTEVALPFDKVLEAFMQMQVRRDQASEETVPQMDTPFSQVTVEDSERFGVPNEPLKGSAKPPVRGEAAGTPNAAAAQPEPALSQKFVPIPATAEAIAAANPEAAAAVERVIRAPAELKTEKPLRIPLATQPVGKGKSEKPHKAPEGIPFHLPPKGTGAPASERVPASSGPPVSTEMPMPPVRGRIPFEGVSTNTILPAEEIAPTGEQKISLALKVILESLPVCELSGDPKEVPEDARVEFSFSLIQPQLASGRIAVTPELFERALPPDGRRFFTAKNLQMPVVLPLQEVLKNLPNDALQVRKDQVEREKGETFETPFSTTAAEDAKRFDTEPPLQPGISAERLPKPAATMQPVVAKAPAVMEPTPTPVAAGKPIPTESTTAKPALDAKAIVAQASALPGVRACNLTFTDGLNLAGNLPTEFRADALCAVAPSVLNRLEAHLSDTDIGNLDALTLHCGKSTVTFFKHANICMTALHTNGELTDEVRRALKRMLSELSRIYPQTETSHVDH